MNVFLRMSVVVALLRSDSGGRSRVITSLLLDRAAGLGAMATVAAAGSILVLGDPRLGWPESITLLVSIACLAGAVLIWYTIQAPWLAGWVRPSQSHERRDNTRDSTAKGNLS